MASNVSTFNFDHTSLEGITGKADQVMVYGFQHCRYTQVTQALEEESSPFKKIFDCSIGGPFVSDKVLTTVEGRKIEQIHIPSLEQVDVVKELKQYCKAGLTNIIMENIKRSREALPLIPVLFVVDIDDNKYQLHPKTIASKEFTFVTMGELRRAYKLCEDKKLSPEVRAIAQETFKFVKTEVHVDKHDKISYSIKQIPPFWEHGKWPNEWALRNEISDQSPPSKKENHKREFWRNTLNRT